MKERRPLRTEATASFTLLEVLVATSALVVIMLLAVQVMTATSRATLGDSRRIDALSQARQALDLFGLDWNARLARPDVAVNILKQPGNDAISFLSQVTALSSTRQVTAIGYRVNPSVPEAHDDFRLERAAYGCNWTGDNAVSFPLATVPAIPATRYQALAQGVIRFEICVLSPPGSSKAGLLANPSPNPVTTLTNLTAVLVSVAVIDDTARRQATSAQLQALVKALPDPTDGAPDPGVLWDSALNRSGFAEGAGIPLFLAQSVRVAERYFYVTLAQ
ncbi:hypothetical protein SAMN05444156_0937 [Verrucomicrobium sp. GAS474]|uniref:PulJ/GspJ family protein n=1 Tax=Verrucomicrobium sp. GAS474 TaxID=1882831 RepID=UPI00087925C1|nr:hypothetical protein [Verrucomicrobium sp. GAS474]SDT94238.1 hypothetical protein SAMN05444156_0937 [Verrucomicrobium sp. GAS474]